MFHLLAFQLANKQQYQQIIANVCIVQLCIHFEEKHFKAMAPTIIMKKKMRIECIYQPTYMHARTQREDEHDKNEPNYSNNKKSRRN